MRSVGQLAYTSSDASDSPLGGFAMSRLGSELALVYHDTLQAPLPRRLQVLVDQLDRAASPVDRQDADEVTRFDTRR